MTLKGKAWTFEDDISTDHIAPGSLFHLRSNLPELAKYILNDTDPEFASKMKTGDFIVAGRNFGIGSTKEDAAIIIKLSGVSAVLAKSFAQPFYRNAINNGLPVIICDTDNISHDDQLDIDLSKGEIKNLSSSKEIRFSPLPDTVINIINDGGLMSHIEKNRGFIE